MKQDSAISLLEAVETLSNIAELEPDPEVGLTQDHDLTVQDKTVSYKTVHWVMRGPESRRSLKVIKNIFTVILQQLREFHTKDPSEWKDPETIEGIKTIMLLVEEATQKLDKFGAFKQENRDLLISDLPEYRKLQDFYQKRIVHKLDDAKLGKWLLALTQQNFKKNLNRSENREALAAHHVFVDLDSVKRDTEYELFFMRKEDGSRFYSPRLVRNIKLVCNFEGVLRADQQSDEFGEVYSWSNKCCHEAAKQLLRAQENRLRRFYKEAMRFRDHELVDLVSKCIMALMLAADPHNLNHPRKNAASYFTDFYRFLREALHSSLYQKMIASNHKSQGKLTYCLLQVIQGLCRSLFTELHFHQDLKGPINFMIHSAGERDAEGHLGAELAIDYTSLTKLAKKHHNAPLEKLLNVLQDGGRVGFDPLLQGNLPSHLYTLHNNHFTMHCLHLPCPTTQDLVHKAQVVEEFKAFVQEYKNDEMHKGRHVIFNFQDRTSWKEHFRCVVLEELQKEESEALTVVTLPKDTDFYNQLAPYNRENHASAFFEAFREQFNDQTAGYFIPEELSQHLLLHFDEILASVHRVFFSSKNVLTLEQRLDFIEICYLLFELKIIEILHPNTFSHICKDGCDTGAMANAELFTFLKLMQPEPITVEDRAKINAFLHVPALLNRERVIQPERFQRFLSMVKCIEAVRDEKGPKEFAKLMQETFKPNYREAFTELEAA